MVTHKAMSLPGTDWHFASGTDAPRMNFGEKQELVIGETYRISGFPIPCQRGLHASARAIDALKYAQGNWVSRVTLGSIIVHDGDKKCAQERTHHVFADATMVLHEFACWCAERALKAERKAGREPDERSWNAIKVKRQWMKGEATDKDLVAARAAAGAAGAASAATWDAARAAARAAAWDATSAATSDATSAATSDASDAARSAQNRKLTAMLTSLLKDGAP